MTLKPFTVMKTKCTFFVILVGVLYGCSSGNSERFIAPSAKSVELASHNGVFWTVPGNPVLDGGTMGPQENLLYLLVVCPGMEAHGRGTGTDYGQRLNFYISRWQTKKGDVSVTVSWDKRTDNVKIGKQQFDRSVGNTFVVVRQPDGNLVSTQLPSPGPNANAKMALNFIQKHMTNDALVASIRLPERD